LKRLDDLLFEQSPTRDHGKLNVSDLHSIYWEEAGNPEGIPLVSIHGGPGGRCRPQQRTLTDPSRFRIIQFDQRGCGNSTPKGELEDNNLQATISDIEQLRESLGIKRWVASGGSWGSTVAIAYAETHPESCIGLKLSCVWLCRQQDTDWWYYGVRTVFPDIWDQYASLVPEGERDDLREAYYRRIMDENPEVSHPAAISQFLYEEAFMHFESQLQPPDPELGISYSRIFAHYAYHDFFLKDNELVNKAHRIANLPVIMVAGRYDMCTPLTNAYDLSKHLNNYQLNVVNAAGHYPTERNMSRAICTANAEFLSMLDRSVESS